MNQPTTPTKAWMSTARLEFRLRTYWRGYRLSEEVTNELLAWLYKYCLAESVGLRHRSHLIRGMVEHLTEQWKTIGVDHINPNHPLRINTIKSREFDERYHALATIAALAGLTMVIIGLSLDIDPDKPDIGRIVALVGMTLSTAAAFIGWKGHQLQERSVDRQDGRKQH